MESTPAFELADERTVACSGGDRPVHDVYVPSGSEDRPLSGRRGDKGVFAGDWAWYVDAFSRRQPVGYAGVLLDVWAEWAVFGYDRASLRSSSMTIGVAWQPKRIGLRACGYTEADLGARLAASTIAMSFDGDEIVVDERAFHADPSAVSRQGPDERGLYVIRGYVWPWIQVDADIGDRIVRRLVRAVVQPTSSGLGVAT